MNSLEIRQGRIEDLPRLTDIYNYYILHTPISFDVTPHSVEERKSSWFSKYRGSGKYQLLVAERDSVVVGYATSSRFRERAAYGSSVETSIYIDKDFHGQGLGTALYEALFERLKSADIHRAYGGVTLPNAGSIALHRKLGFREIGIYNEVGFKFGKFYDVCWLEKALDE